MPDTVFLSDRIEVTRPIPAQASAIFDILRSPAGLVAIDASGMLQDFTGEPADKLADTFVMNVDRESLHRSTTAPSEAQPSPTPTTN